MPRDTLPVDRDTIRDFVRKARTHDPSVGRHAMHQTVEQEFGVKISSANFDVTYWRKADPKRNGTKATSTRKKRQPRKQVRRHARAKGALVPANGGGVACAQR